jgi:hypothetical protein
MHLTAERLSVGVEGYLRQVMGNVSCLRFQVVAVRHNLHCVGSMLFSRFTSLIEEKASHYLVQHLMRI